MIVYDSLRFIYNADQLKTINSIVVGIVERTDYKGSSFVPAYLISNASGFVVIFQWGTNSITSVSIQEPRLKETSRLVNCGNSFIGVISFNLGDQDDQNFLSHTKLLYPEMSSSLYQDSMSSTSISAKLSAGSIQFNALDLIFKDKEEISNIDFNFFASKLNQILSLDIEVLGAYVLNMIQ